MPTVKDFFDYLNSFAPISTQEDWDNSGMLIGDINCEVSKVGVALDITSKTVESAKANCANLIISHHPVIFSPLKSITKGCIQYDLIQNSINALCFHTPLDIAEEGTNDTLSRLLGIKTERCDNPILRFAEIEPTNAQSLAEMISAKLGAHIRFADSGKPIKKIAICTGAGCSLIEEAGEIDAFITGDASYHNFLDCVESGISLIAAGHFETENPIVPVLVKELQKRFPSIDIIDLGQQNTIKYI